MRIVIGIALVALVPLGAHASELDYTYVEFGYVNTEIDAGGGLDVDGDGFGLRGSYEINEDYFIFAGYSSVGFDASVDLNQLELGGGMHVELSPTMDFVGAVSFVDAEVDTPFGDVSEDGLGLGIGVRARHNEAFEWEAGLDYVDLGDSNLALRLAGRYYFSPNSAVGAGIAFDDDATALSIGIRFEFGN